MVLSPVGVMTAFANTWDPTMPLPNRPLTADELNAWIAHYCDGGGISALEMEILALTNYERTSRGIAPLAIDYGLFRAARFKSQNMVDLNYFSHTNPVYGSWQVIPGLFITSGLRAENIASGGGTAQGIVNMWMGSDGHRANILNPAHTVIGIGSVSGRSTQMFGTNVQPSSPACVCPGAVFVPVTNITGIPTTANVGQPITLAGTVVPANATNRTITWAVSNAGGTGAAITGSTLTTTATGTLTITATIVNGATETTPYTQQFTISVTRSPGASIQTPAMANVVTYDSITVTPAVLAPTTGQTVEYAINNSSTTVPSVWQASTAFTGLTPDTTYFVWSRAAESASHSVGAVSVVEINTLPLPGNDATLSTLTWSVVGGMPNQQNQPVNREEAATGGVLISLAHTTTTGSSLILNFTPNQTGATANPASPLMVELTADDGRTGTATITVTSPNTLFTRTYTITFTIATAPITHTIIYSANGGAGTMPPSNVYDGDDYTLRANTFTRPGHTFTGWNTVPDGSGMAFAPRATINNVSGDWMLYAQWRVGAPSPGPGNASLNVNQGSFDGANPQSITLTLTLGGLTLVDIRLGNTTLVRGTDFTVSGNQVTISANFLATLTTGHHVLTFVMSSGSNPQFTVTATAAGDPTPTPTPTPGVTPAPGDPTPTPTPGDDTDWPVPPTPPPSATPAPTPPAQQVTFADITPGAWYASYVRIVTERQLFQGTAPNTFSPRGNMTRAMFVQVLANLEGVDLSSYRGSTGTFGDTASTAWYFGAVEWAAGQGLAGGVGGGNFAPGRPITREEMAILLNRYIVSRGISLPQGATPPFSDSDSISAWALDGVIAMQAAGIITGHPDGRFAPQNTATRAEVATIFARLLNAAGI